ncbi:MAG: hydroxymethylglutaryl-CoA synthase family protein [Proteobacteria bacterium]|nr:hydroxymethylglutaryl-CoA synthase family protein [Pseudomonadota bacterium]
MVVKNHENGLLGHTSQFGVSGFSFYVPRFRVPLENWCEWTGNSWQKVKATVGHSFRVIGPHESLYTMAANAVLRLILKYGVDPKNVGFIGLGTESSGDNSAGAVLIKGMVDRALKSMGLPRLARNCEVPEFKHACLGGVYALKNGLRYLAYDGKGRCAIVVSADIAEYERGSSGEPTQGACAVAQLLEENPKLYGIDLLNSGSTAAYRGVDFRKPHRRHLSFGPPQKGAVRSPDYPVFNGRYSTICYTDQAIHAVDCMLEKLGSDPRSLYHMAEGWFLHRPYHRMPINIMAALYVWGLSRNREQLPELKALCAEADANYEQMIAEATSSPDLFQGALTGEINKEVYPEAMKVVKYFRYTPKFNEVMSRKMYLGTQKMMDLGNVYTGSLPAWIAAGLEGGLERGLDLAGKNFFTLGYGSGDAAEAMLIQIAEDWRNAAGKIGLSRALEGSIDLTQEEYEALHDGLASPCPSYEPSKEFVVDRVGRANDPEFQDIGIEYYRYVSK